MTELLLDGDDPRMSLAADLRECVECGEEFRALKETLGLTTRLIETATPPDNYWPGYHARLKEKLYAAQQPRALDISVEPGQHYTFFTASLRVPVPVAFAVAAVVVLAFVLSVRPAAEPTIVRVPVEVPVSVPVPVIQERTVERIVYREKRSRQPKPAPTIAAPADPTLASLEGFQPTEEVKLTVIKGGSPNEK
ncbi:MAG TPA: hypothetical protein VFS77_22560 [Pyrinomonadaceae bacterium]|nr:hypothetical protein [Pyrinomonadaceae bacterium]